jgi:hypothetical protein
MILITTSIFFTQNLLCFLYVDFIKPPHSAINQETQAEQECISTRAHDYRSSGKAAMAVSRSSASQPGEGERSGCCSTQARASASADECSRAGSTSRILAQVLNPATEPTGDASSADWSAVPDLGPPNPSKAEPGPRRRNQDLEGGTRTSKAEPGPRRRNQDP